MTKTSAVISFTSSLAEAGFALEQKEWPTKNPTNFTEWLEQNGSNPTGGNIITAWIDYLSSCTENGDLCPTLRVRLHDINTPYVLRASYGTLDPAATLVTETRVEFLAFELDTEQSVDFGTITRAVWNGEVYDENGDIVTSPAITLSGRTATTPFPVYGVLEVDISETLYEHVLTISPRTPTAEQAESTESITDELYASTAMLFCSGEIELLDIEMPENFGTCSGAYGGTTINDDEEEDDSRQYAVNFEVFDYCTGDVISDATITVDGITVDSAVATILAGGGHTVRVTAPGYTASDEDDLADNDSFTLGSSATNG